MAMRARLQLQDHSARGMGMESNKRRSWSIENSKSIFVLPGLADANNKNMFCQSHDTLGIHNSSHSRPDLRLASFRAVNMAAASNLIRFQPISTACWRHVSMPPWHFKMPFCHCCCWLWVGLTIGHMDGAKPPIMKYITYNYIHPCNT